MEVISREEAKERGLKVYFTGSPCVNGHVEQRRTKTACCLACDRLRSRAFRLKNPEYARSHSKLRYELLKSTPEGKEKINSSSRKWCSNNKDKRAAIRKKWVNNNPSYNLEWCMNNRARSNHIKNMYRYKKLRATPPWLSTTQKLEIENFYRVAQQYRAETGLRYHVDHIIPIQGDGVCGLHVPWNLQVLTASQNASKRNTYE